MMTILAQERFNVQISALQDILSRAKSTRDKGKSVYKNKGRDVLFRLEALCRIYREIHDKKFFDFWYKRFKLLEDVLGDMDFNESVYKEFSAYKSLKKETEKLYLTRFEEEAAYLTEVLTEAGWTSGAALKQFSEGLDQGLWKSDEEDRFAYGSVMCLELDKVVSKYREGELDMFKLEEGMHEFRRKLRWVSIYAQTANGLVQLRMEKNVPDGLKDYCTEAITSSPFNVLPKAKGIKDPIYIQSHYFYALSWMISRLSVLKDTRFRYEVFNTLCKTCGVKDKKITSEFLATCEIDPTSVFTAAESVVDRFIYNDIIPERIRRDIKRSIA